MMAIAEGIAHVSFAGGGLFVPARSPYDREMLVEHVLDRVRSKGSVQVLVDERRWLVDSLRGTRAVRCERCDCVVDCVSRCHADDSVGYCVACALLAPGQRRRPPRSKVVTCARRTADSAA